MLDNPSRNYNIIIVTRNSSVMIESCVKSLLQYAPEAEIIIIDNNSSDKTVEIIKSFKGITLIENKSNVGFATACHQGVSVTEKDSLLFLNPDAIITNNIFKQVEELFKEDNKIGIIGPQLVYEDMRHQHSVRKFPDLKSQIIMFFKIDHIFKNIRSVNEYLLNDFDYGKMKEVDQVMGAFFVTKRELWERVGGFDKRFFIWFEEVDYCYMIKKLGYKVIYAPIGPVIHGLGKSFFQESIIKKQFWFFSSMIKYFLKRVTNG